MTFQEERFFGRPVRRWIVIFFVTGGLLRLGFSLYVGGRFIQPDEQGYHALAVNMARFGVFGSGQEPTAFYPPAYPFFVSVIYRLFGESVLAVRIIQSWLGLGTAACIWLFTRRAFGARPGMIACGLAGLYPFFIYYDGVLLTESFFIFLFCLGLVFWDAACFGRKHRPLWTSLAGLIWGVNALCRSTMIPVAMLLAAVSLLGSPDPWRARFKKHALLIAVFSLPLLLWAVRNKGHFGHAVLDLHGGYNLIIGVKYADENRADTEAAVAALLKDYPSAAEMDPVSRDRFFMEETKRWVKNHPEAYARRVARNFLEFWRLFPRQKREGARDRPFLGQPLWLFALISFPCELGLILLGLRGAMRSRPLWPRLIPIFALIIGLTVVYSLSVGQMRYRLPVMAGMMVLASHGIMHILPRPKDVV